MPTIAGATGIATLVLLVGLFAGGMTSASAATSPANALKAYQKCLASHGVKNLPRGSGFGGRFRGGNGGQPPTGSAPTNGSAPAGGGTGRTAPKLTSKQQKAVKACQSKLPKGGVGGGFRGGNGGAGGPGGAAFTAYLTCLTQHGVNIPTDGSGFRGINRNDPTVQAAETACASLRPNFGGQQGGGQQGGGQQPATSGATA